MLTAQRVEGTVSRYGRQGRRWALTATALCVWPLGPSVVEAQQLPFTVTIVDWQPGAMQRQRRMYLSIPNGHEVLFCVEAWRTEDPKDGVQKVTVTQTRREDTGSRHNLDQVVSKCLDRNGAALPTIHTHSEGNCQPSPNDIAMIAARGAPFDGIQCGEHYVVWVYAWQYKAISTAMYESQRPPP